MHTIKIKEKQIYVEVTAPRASIVYVKLVDWRPHESATFEVVVSNEDSGTTFEMRHLKLEGEDLKRFANDDFALNWICRKLGVEALESSSC